MERFAIHSTRTVTSHGVEDATLIIANGVIEDVISGIPDAFEGEITDVGDDVLMAGIVDPHVHINEPGRTEWEGFDTATRAALAGGITTLVDMPLNSSPVTTCETAFHEKLAAARQYLHTNCGFWGGIIPGNTADIVPLIEGGVLGFKAFLIDSGIEEFPAVTEQDLRKVMPIIAKHNLPLLVHCEIAKGDEESLTRRSQRSRRKADHNTVPEYENDHRSYIAYLKSRPRKWETDAIALMIRLCEEYNCRTHIVHVSSSESLELLVNARHSGLPLTAETAQHYLFFSAEEIPDGRTEFKCAPPIRDRANNDKLWGGLLGGILDFVATDHSPAPPELKELDSGNFIRAWGGISSLQFALPAFWTVAKRHNCQIDDIAKWLCERPADFISSKKKGRIEKGCDADLVVWSPEEHYIVNGTMILHKHRVTPYLHEELFGVVKKTYLSGKIVFENGEFLKLNQGRVVINGGMIDD